MRFVTHLDYTDAQHDYVLKCIKQLANTPMKLTPFVLSFIRRNLFLSLVLSQACTNLSPEMKPDQSLVPPLADQKPYQHKLHNDIRVDEFYWLKERDNPEVIDYLEREKRLLSKIKRAFSSFTRGFV